MTFPVASGIVTVVWKVLEKVFPSWGSSNLVPLVVSLLVGMLIYAMSDVPGTTKDRLISFAIAILNSFTLAAAALGVNSAVNS